MRPIQIIKSKEARIIFKDSIFYEELNEILESCMYIDAYDKITRVMFKDFDYILIIENKRDSRKQFICPGAFNSTFILRPIYIAGDEAILSQSSVGGIITSCNIESIEETMNEFNQSPIYNNIIKSVIILNNTL